MSLADNAKRWGSSNQCRSPLRVFRCGRSRRSNKPKPEQTACSFICSTARIVLDEGREVMLKHGGSEIHAPYIEYQMPAEDSPSPLGELRVAGPGWLRAVPDVARADRVIDITWKEGEGTQVPLQLTRRNEQPILLLSGYPVIDAHRLGKIAAQRMELNLREVPADGEQGAAIELDNSPNKLAVLPERLLASGNVVFDSTKLSGSTHQLQGDFAAWQASAANTPTNRLTSSADREEDPNKPTSKYDLSANQIQLDLALTGKSAEPTAVSCEGSVVFRETQTAKPDEQPVEVRGTRLTVDQLDQEAKITVFGRHDPQLGTPGTATISARGLTLAAEQIHADQQTGRFWINGPGRRHHERQWRSNLASRPGTTTPVTLTWQTKLDAAGRRIVATGRILAESQQGWVQADTAVALLTAPLKFGKESACRQDRCRPSRARRQRARRSSRYRRERTELA